KDGKRVLEGPHYHIYLNFGRATIPFDMVAGWFGVEPQYVKKIQKTGSMLDYLTHANESQQFKHQYAPEEVTANFDFVKEAEIERTFGDFTKYSYAQQIAYVHSLSADKQLKYYTELKKRWELECAYRSLNSERNIEVMFITGKGGTGKTTYAKKLLREKLKYDFCISSSSNDPFQDYKGQWGIVLDDCRDYWFEFEDLLKILDNHTASSIIGRYNNKIFDGKIIIITSKDEPWKWYKEPIQTRGRKRRISSDDLNQFYRRISCYVEVTKEEITVYNEGLDETGHGKGVGQCFVNDLWKYKQETRPRTDFAKLFGEMCESPEVDKVFPTEQLTMKEIKAIEKQPPKRDKR
ncbi:MAG: hypothetical protein ACI4RO_00235, partial [Candidatus Scatosoma sp.]